MKKCGGYKTGAAALAGAVMALAVIGAFVPAASASGAAAPGEGSKGGEAVRLLDPEYDFGIMRELDGPKTGSARIVNVGSKPTYISDVRPSCGCTGADFTKEPLAPGDTAMVSFTYNPIGRPGNINKTVKVYVGEEGTRYVIKLKGRVVGSAETLAVNYPVECGRLRLSERVLEMGNIKAGSARHGFVRLVNQSMDTVAPVFENAHKALSVDVTPKVLAPGEIATLGVYLNTRFATDSISEPEYTLPVSDGRDSILLQVRARLLPEEPEEIREPGMGQ